MGFIGRYETYEEIGTGSMGSVYRARDIVLDREVALKVMHTGPELDPELKERFYREAKAGAKLQHPSIVVVYDLGEASGVAYIAMELLTGADLRQYIAEPRPLSLAQKIEYLTQVCDGLAHAHRAGIVHRDIKPSNIYIHQERQAKVLDFGIARLPSSKLTIVGKVLGTPNYMAPEQILSLPCDARSDLFSAGIVFFEFLVNAHPFRSSFVPRRIAEEEPDSLCCCDPSVPRSLDELLKRALQKNPEERIQTAEEFSAALRAIREDLRKFDVAPASTPDRGSAVQTPTTPILPTSVATGQNEDSAQSRVSEFIRILRQFDEAMAQDDINVARNCIEHMRQLAEVDGRFAEAVGEYRRKLQNFLEETPRSTPAGAVLKPATDSQTEPQPLPSSRPPILEKWDETLIFSQGNAKEVASVSAASPDPILVVKNKCRFCGAENDPKDRYCEGCGKDFLGSHSASDIREPKRAAFASKRAELFSIRRRWNADKINVIGNQIRSYTRKWSETCRRSVSTFSPFQKRALGISITATVLIIAAAITANELRSVPTQRALGQAVVESKNASLLESPSATGKQLLSLRQGTTVNIIDKLTSANQTYVRVQFVSPATVSRPGYVRTLDLGRWSSDDPAAAWNFLITFRPGDSASENQQRDFLKDLDSFAIRFPGTQQAGDAYLRNAQVHVSLARTRQHSGRIQECEGELGQARVALSNVNGDPEHNSQLATIQNELKELDVACAAPETAVSQNKPSNVDELLGRLPQLWDAANFAGILDIVRQIESLDPANGQARSWRKRVADAQRAYAEAAK